MRQISSSGEVDSAVSGGTAILYKHSFTCPISAAAHKEMESFLGRNPDAPFFMVDVNGSADHLWRLLDAGGGWYRLQVQHSLNVLAVDGMSTEAYVELFCRGTVAPDELQRILQGVPEVVYAGTVTGSADAIVHMRARDITSLEDALERVRIAPNVDHTRSAIVLSRLVNRNRD